MKISHEKTSLAMARACMNMSDVAEKAGMSFATVKNAVYGRAIRPRTAGLIARALGVDVTEIIEQEN